MRLLLLQSLVFVFFWWAQATGASLPVAEASTEGMSAQKLSSIDGIVETAVQEGKVPGVVVLVGRGGHIVYRKAFGHRSLTPEPEAMTVDTLFDLSSLTKVIATAPSLMILVEEGLLTLDDPVELFLPDFGENGKDKVTILQLATHFSGLRAGLDLDQAWSGFDEGLRRASGEELVAQPDSRFIYSDTNYLVLSAVIRAVSGKPLDEFATERVFRPLGMMSTTFTPPLTWKSRIAPTQRRGDGLLRGQVHDPLTGRLGGVSGNAGLFSTADDLAIYAQMILNGGSLGQVRVLSPLSVRRMTTSQSPPGQNACRGVGFDIDSAFSSSRGDLFPVGSFGHTGFTGTSVWIDPESHVFLIVLSSRLHPEGEGDVSRLRRQLANIVAASIEAPPSG